jgi:hypothetical protein
VVLVHPAPGETLVPDDPLVWRAVPGALDYELVLADPDGNTVVRRVTGDTIAAVDLPPGVAAMQWWVTVRLADGSTRRSGSRTLRAPAP